MPVPTPLAGPPNGPRAPLTCEGSVTTESRAAAGQWPAGGSPLGPLAAGGDHGSGRAAGASNGTRVDDSAGSESVWEASAGGLGSRGCIAVSPVHGQADRVTSDGTAGH